MIGTSFVKPVADWEAYAQAAEWCNANGARIVEYDDRYEIEALPEKTFDELKAQKKQDIVTARYDAETGGCTVDGVRIATDRGSQALLTAAVVSARLDPEFKTRWKCADGYFVDLNAMQLRAIGDAVIAHVEACFAREAELVELIDAAQTPDELDAIQWSM
jgi:hypothetical protein